MQTFAYNANIRVAHAHILQSNIHSLPIYKDVAHLLLMNIKAIHQIRNISIQNHMNLVTRKGSCYFVVSKLLTGKRWFCFGLERSRNMCLFDGHAGWNLHQFGNKFKSIGNSFVSYNNQCRHCPKVLFNTRVHRQPHLAHTFTRVCLPLNCTVH